jgi:hypothetical protein
MARIKGKHAWAMCLDLLDKDDMVNMNFNVNPMTFMFVSSSFIDQCKRASSSSLTTLTTVYKVFKLMLLGGLRSGCGG